MAFPKADIVSGKSVIPVFVREFLPHGKLIYDILKNLEIESALLASLRSFLKRFERTILSIT